MRRNPSARLAALLLALAAGATAQEERPALLSLDLAYTGEVFSNVSGGIHQSSRYLDNIDLSVSLDGATAFGVEGLTLFAYALYDNGAAVSGDLVGDAQGVSNIEADRAVRLYEAWVDQDFAVASLRAGLYDLNTEFDAIEAAGLFLNASHGIGPDFAQSGLNGPSIFPSTSLGARIAVPLGSSLLRFAALDGVPGDPRHPKRTTIRFDEGDGALLAWQVERAFEAGPRAALGVWRYTGRFERVRDVVLGAPGPRLGGNTGYYAFVESPLWREGGGGQGLAGFLRVGFADARVNVLSSYVGAGAVYTGLFPGRDDDQLGFAVATARFGEEYRRAQRSLGSPWDASEINLELSYRFPVADWLVLQPDVQYVVNPSGDPTLENALAFGLRFELAAGLRR